MISTKNRNDRFVRKPALSELLFLDAATMGYSMGQHAILKIDRAPSLAQLEQALEASMAQAGNLDLCFDSGVWLRAEDPCPCHLVESDCEDIFQVPLPHIDHARHTLWLQAIHLRPCDQWYLRFTLSHCAGDGISLVNFLYLFFAALGQTPMMPCHFGIQEHDFTKVVKRKPFSVPLRPVCQPPVGATAPQYYHKRTEQAPYLPTATLCHLTASCFSHSKAIMLVPLGLRRYCPAQDDLIMGNLVLPLFLDAAHQDVDQIHRKIHTFATDNRLPVFGKLPVTVYRAIPGRLRRGVLDLYIRWIRRSKKVPVAALVSNVGKIQSALLENPYFRVEDCYVAFQNLPVFALTLISVSMDDHTNICFSTHDSPISQEAAQALAHRIPTTLQIP